MMTRTRALGLAQGITRATRRRSARWPAQAEVFERLELTTSAIKKLCGVTYLRARSLRGGMALIRSEEADQLPEHVVDELRKHLPAAARMQRAKGRRFLVLDKAAARDLQLTIGWEK